MMKHIFIVLLLSLTFVSQAQSLPLHAEYVRENDRVENLDGNAVTVGVGGNRWIERFMVIPSSGIPSGQLQYRIRREFGAETDWINQGNWIGNGVLQPKVNDGKGRIYGIQFRIVFLDGQGTPANILHSAYSVKYSATFHKVSSDPSVDNHTLTGENGEMLSFDFSYLTQFRLEIVKETPEHVAFQIYSSPFIKTVPKDRTIILSGQRVGEHEVKIRVFRKLETNSGNSSQEELEDEVRFDDPKGGKKTILEQKVTTNSAVFRFEVHVLDSKSKSWVLLPSNLLDYNEVEKKCSFKWFSEKESGKASTQIYVWIAEKG